MNTEEVCYQLRRYAIIKDDLISSIRLLIDAYDLASGTEKRNKKDEEQVAYSFLKSIDKTVLSFHLHRNKTELRYFTYIDKPFEDSDLENSRLLSQFDYLEATITCKSSVLLTTLGVCGDAVNLGIFPISTQVDPELMNCYLPREDFINNVLLLEQEIE